MPKKLKKKKPELTRLSAAEKNELINRYQILSAIVIHHEQQMVLHKLELERVVRRLGGFND